MFAGIRAIMQSHGPTILTVAGVIGVTGAGVMACKATIKAAEIKVEMVSNIEVVKENEYSNESEYNAAIRHEYIEACRGFIKCYGPAILIGALSIGSIIYGHNILNKRNLVLAGAYKALTLDYDGYRKRVFERLGPDMERSIAYDMQTAEIGDMDGNTQTIEYVPEKELGNAISIRSIFFDEASIYWEEDPEKNKEFLLTLQRRAQEKYDKDGFLFLNWIYKNLDIAETYASTVCGWVKGYSDDEIDFGIYDIYSAASRRFVNGLEPVILLNFNDSGYIADKI